MFQDLQNTYVQFINKSQINQQTDVYPKIPPPTLLRNQDHTHIQINNNNTSTPNTNELKLSDGYNKQQIETASFW